MENHDHPYPEVGQQISIPEISTSRDKRQSGHKVESIAKGNKRQELRERHDRP